MNTKIVKKPWGYYEDYYRSGDIVCKKIVVNPGQRLSLQRHKNRKEIWFIKSGGGLLENETISEKLKKSYVFIGCVIQIEVGKLHRIICTTDVPLVIYEMQCSLVGQCSEDDIERISDDYGR
jgi:mannose-6-phosphate isomerase-like protein (cupin superfamily)